MMNLEEIWDTVMPPERRWLGMIVMLVALLHLLALAWVQIDLPAGSLQAPRARQVTLMLPVHPPGTIGEESWAVWLDWKDPSAIALPWTPLLPPALPPSTPALSAPPPVPPLPLEDPLPGGQGLGIGQRAAQSLHTTRPPPMPIPLETPPALSGTLYRIDGLRSGRSLLTVPRLPRPRTDLALQRTVLNVLINRSGLVESALVQDSSMDPAVDMLAVQNVRTWRFTADPTAPEPEAVRVTFFWDLQAKSPLEPNAP